MWGKSICDFLMFFHNTQTRAHTPGKSWLRDLARLFLRSSTSARTACASDPLPPATVCGRSTQRGDGSNPPPPVSPSGKSPFGQGGNDLDGNGSVVAVDEPPLALRPPPPVLARCCCCCCCWEEG